MTVTSPTRLPYARVAILGAGLIGTSLAHAIRARDPECLISFADSNPDTITALGELFPDCVASTDPAKAVRDADLVMLCVPVGAVGIVSGQIAAHVKPGVTVSDVGSVKRSVMEAMREAFGPDVHVIAGHPVAGSEQSGPRAGFAELFENRYVILTPGEEFDIEALQNLTRFWRRLGAIDRKSVV